MNKDDKKEAESGADLSRTGLSRDDLSRQGKAHGGDHSGEERDGADRPEDPGAGHELAELRKQIDAVDEQIVSLLAQRQAVVDGVVQLKKSKNLPIYHPAREEDLISKRRRQSIGAGLNPDFVEDLYRTIIRRSRVEQTSRMAMKNLRPGAALLIAGGRGQMGRYFVRCFAEAGYEVRVLEKEDWPNVETLCRGIDLAIVSVPIDRTERVIRQLAPHLPEDAVLSDLASIKKRPVKAMLDAHPGPVIGLHPLFGPSTSSFDKQIIVATPGRDSDACRWVPDQLGAWGAVVVNAAPKEHDEIMDIVQALRHFATFAFGRFLHRKKVNLARSLEFSSPIYRLELGMVGRLFAQDPTLYAEIIFASPERRALLKDFVESVNENLEMLESGDKEGFQEAFGQIAAWFGPFGDQAMRESTYIIDKLIERF